MTMLSFFRFGQCACAPTQYRRHTDVIPTLVFGLFTLCAGSAFAAEVPSGQSIELHEVLIDAQDETTWLRFRFIAPQIARGEGQITYAEAEPDIIHLCNTVALPYIDQFTLAGEVIVISLADREIEFGQPDPDATQFFEAFRAQDGACIWADF